MRKIRLIALTIVALGAIGVVTINAQAANGNNGEKTFTVFEQKTEFGANLVNAPSSSVGDVIALSSDLYADSSHQKKVGHAGIVCTQTSILRGPAGEVQCSFTAVLSGGQIATSTLVDLALVTTPGATFSAAVLGGTGRYQNASGEATFKVIDQFDSIDTFRLN
jgi:Dirigent-like protein